MRRALLVALLLSGPLSAQPVPTSVNGTLERVMEHSLTVLLADGRLVDCTLPGKSQFAAKSLVAKYKLGDQISIDCKPIPYFWDEEASLPRMLELQKLKFVRRPSPQQLDAALKCRDWRVPGNLLDPPQDITPPLKVRRPILHPKPENTDAPDPEITLEQARTVILDRADHLPNFVADEIAHCAGSRTDPPEWQATSLVDSEVTFVGMGQKRTTRTINGQPYNAPGVPKGCMGYAGGFGTFLRPLFDPECGTTLHFSKQVGQPGNQGLLYTFQTPAESCFSTSFAGPWRAYPAREGLVLLEIPGGNLLQVVSRSIKFPDAYPIRMIEEKIGWNFVSIDNQKHLLPVIYEKLMYLRAGGVNRVIAEYKNHRHFEANSAITFH